MSVISSIECQLFRVPLPEVMSDAMHGDHTHFELVTATVRLEDGTEGTGYTYTGGKGGHAIRALIVHDLVPMLLGECNDPAESAQVRPLKRKLQQVSSYSAPDAGAAGCRS